MKTQAQSGSVLFSADYEQCSGCISSFKSSISSYINVRLFDSQLFPTVMIRLSSQPAFLTVLLTLLHFFHSASACAPLILLCSDSKLFLFSLLPLPPPFLISRSYHPAPPPLPPLCKVSIFCLYKTSQFSAGLAGE